MAPKPADRPAPSIYIDYFHRDEPREHKSAEKRQYTEERRTGPTAAR